MNERLSRRVSAWETENVAQIRGQEEAERDPEGRGMNVEPQTTFSLFGVFASSA